MSNLRGFTLVEMLIYTSIFVVMALAFLAILGTFTRVDTAQQATSEVANQANFVMQQVRRLVAASSYFEVKGAGSDELWLYPQNYTTNPTKIVKSGGAITLSEGGAAAAPLTTGKVTVDALTFAKYANPPGPDVVRIDMTLSYVNPASAEKGTRSFRTAVARVSAATFDTDIVPNADNVIDVGLAGQRFKNAVFSGGIGIGAVVPIAPIRLEIDGGLRLNTVTAKPACGAGTRGVFWVTQGGAGVKDNVEVCAKDAANAYAWRTIY
jgi:type II secretory pathway pseudopilin PulG